MKFAIFADLHLTENPYSIKLIVLNWALSEAKKEKVDCIVGIGDLTATGTNYQADLLFKQINKSGIPFYSTPGNAELRSNENGAERLTILPDDDFPIVLIDSSRECPDKKSIKSLESLNVGANKLLVSHYSPQFWKMGKDLFDNAVKRKAVTAVIAGHIHDDRPGCLRGLDPDKASGGPPMFSIFENDNDCSWKKRDIVMPDIDPDEWNELEWESFCRCLGVACLQEPLETLKSAAEIKIPVLELRYGYPPEVTDELCRAVECWRSSGGKILSIHLPEVYPDNKESLVIFRKSVQFSLALGCDRVTVHVPRLISILYDTERYKLIELYHSLLQPLLERNILIGIENLHTNKGKTSDDQRNFGCNIEECRDFIQSLRKRCQSDLIGFHLDIGHARNNIPFSAVQNVSDYYNAEGLPINGFHFHQVVIQEDGSYKNHAPIKDLYGKLISLAGYIIARRAGAFSSDAPVILEINTPGGGIESYKFIRSLRKGL